MQGNFKQKKVEAPNLICTHARLGLRLGATWVALMYNNLSWPSSDTEGPWYTSVHTDQTNDKVQHEKYLFAIHHLTDDYNLVLRGLHAMCYVYVLCEWFYETLCKKGITKTEKEWFVNSALNESGGHKPTKYLQK